MGQGVSTIKSQIQATKSPEEFVMRMRMKHFVVDPRFPTAGAWEVFNGFVKDAVPHEGPIELAMATYNIWFDQKTAPMERWNAVLDLLLDEKDPLDVLALQEVIEGSWKLILEREEIRKNWVVVDFSDVLERSSNTWYATALLVCKTWLQKYDMDQIDMSLTRYQSTQTRALLALEVGNADGVKLRIGTSHFESTPNDISTRQRQFYAASRLLSYPMHHSLTESPATPRRTVDEFLTFLTSPDALSPTASYRSTIPPSIICGDFNLDSYDELKPLLSPPLSYIDTFATAHPVDDKTDKYRSHPSFGSTYNALLPPGPMKDPRRIDYVLANPGNSSVRVVEARLIGDSPVVGKDGEKIKCEWGRDGLLYPSDHLGLVVKLVFGGKQDE